MLMQFEVSSQAQSTQLVNLIRCSYEVNLQIGVDSENLNRDTHRFQVFDEGLKRLYLLHGRFSRVCSVTFPIYCKPMAVKQHHLLWRRRRR
jgi:hypothetical protein